MVLNYLVYTLEKYGFIIIVLFCFGFFAPNLIPKLSMMTNDASAVAEKISGSNIVKQVFWLSIFTFYMWRLLSSNILTVMKWEMLLVLLFAAGGLALISIFWSYVILKSCIMQDINMTYAFKSIYFFGIIGMLIYIGICLTSQIQDILNNK